MIQNLQQKEKEIVNLNEQLNNQDEELIQKNEIIGKMEESLKKDESISSDSYLRDALQDQIDDLNSQLNDKKNEIKNLKNDCEEINENLKILKVIPKNKEEKEALDMIYKILIKINN